MIQPLAAEQMQALLSRVGIVRLCCSDSSLLTVCRDIAGSDVRFEWITDEPCLVTQGVVQWTECAHVCAVHSEGMVASLTQTILAAYGSMVTTLAGMLMNNAARITTQSVRSDEMVGGGRAISDPLFTSS
jgi:Gamma-glutamyltranspeptidase